MSTLDNLDATLTAWRARGRYLEVDGHRLFYVREGRGPTLLAIHGYPLGAFDFSGVWAQLTAAHDVIAVDMPGFGFSSKPQDFGYDFDTLTALHETITQQLELDRVHVVAADLGTAIAQEMLARAVEGKGGAALASVCFLNGNLFPEMYRPRFIQRILASPIGAWVAPRLPRRAIGRAIASAFGPHTQPTAADLARFATLVEAGDGLRVTHRLNRLIFARASRRDRWVHAMQKTTVPLRFVNGPADPNSGEHMARRYEELIPNADVVRVGPDIGHWPTLEAPDATAAAIAAHIARAR